MTAALSCSPADSLLHPTAALVAALICLPPRAVSMPSCQLLLTLSSRASMGRPRRPSGPARLAGQGAADAARRAHGGPAAGLGAESRGAARADGRALRRGALGAAAARAAQLVRIWRRSMLSSAAVYMI